MQNIENNFLKGKITIPLIRFTIPLALALIVQALYGAVDMAIVGHFGTSSDVSAVGIGSSIMQGLTAIFTGLSMGVTVSIGHSIGAKQFHKASQTMGGMFILFTILAIVITIPMLFCAEFIAKIMTTPIESFEKTISYIQICSLGLIFISLYNGFAGLFRGCGNSKAPLYIVLVACIINIIGDFILVAKFNMGTNGAAIATIVAQAFSIIFAFLYLKYLVKLPFRFKYNNMINSISSIKETVKIGTPIALQDLLNYVSYLIIVSIVNSLGLLASVAVSIESKIFAFFILMPVSFMSSISAFVAQNIGANQEERALKALRRAMLISLISGLVCFVLAFWYGEFLAGIFEKNPIAIQSTARMLKGASFEHFFFSIVFCFLGYFNGRALTLFVVIQGVIAAFLIRIPLAYIISRSGNNDLFIIGLAFSISGLVSLFLSIGYFFYKRQNSKDSLVS